MRPFISRMSQYLTLHPGDVPRMGTDVVEIEIPDIGALRSPVGRAQSRLPARAASAAHLLKK